METAFFPTPESIQYITRLLVAALLGGLIGFERDIHGRAAGLRTHLLVCMGSALFMILSEIIAAQGQTGRAGIQVFSDPGRIAAQVVTGIGFLGAGTIIKEGITIRGLTTAACLWIVAAIGLAVGANHFHLAISTTILAIVSLVLLHYLERLYPKDSYRSLTITTANEVRTATILESINSKELKIMYIELDRDYDTGLTTIKMFIRLFHKGLTDGLCHGIIASLEKADIAPRRIRWDHQ